MMKDVLNTAINAALEAGKSILEIYHSGVFDTETKGDNSPLTKADIASHNVIISYLTKNKIPVLSEEVKAIPYEECKNWNHLWIVDPIDGTKEFIKLNGESTVNIALIENQQPLIGVIFVPATGDLYFSSKEEGAFKVLINLEDYDVETLISNANKLPLQQEDSVFTIVVSRSHTSIETEAYVQEMRTKYGQVKLTSKGSSLKFCLVAEGVAHCYPRFASTMEWDTAARQTICEHTGSKIIDIENKIKMIYNRKNLLNNSLLVN